MTYKSCLSCPEFGTDFFAHRSKGTFMAEFGKFAAGLLLISISWLKVILEVVFTLLFPVFVLVVLRLHSHLISLFTLQGLISLLSVHI